VPDSTTPFTQKFPCPICRGHRDMKRGHSQRCHGFLSSDGSFAHCSREELAGDLSHKRDPNSETWPHRLEGPCACGETHGERPRENPKPRQKDTRSPQKTEGLAYSYVDDAEVLRFQTVRYEPKDFRQRRPDGAGGWIWNLDGVVLILYRLRELRAALAAGDPVYIVEGEKDADRLHEEGYVATTSPMGAGKWRDEYSDVFRNTESKIVVVRDRDDVGKRHAGMVVASLRTAGIEGQLREALEGKDASDHLDAGLTVEQLVDPEALLRFTAKEMIEMKAPDVRYLVDQLIPLSGLSTILARSKVGKSTLARGLAICVATGEDFLGFETQKGRVLYLALEEDIIDVRRHFLQLGLTEDMLIDTVPMQPRQKDLVRLVGKYVAECKPRLVVVDTFRKVVEDGIDWHSYGEMAAAMEPWLQLSRERAVHVTLLHHARKAADEDGNVVGLGSTALDAVPDVILSMRKDANGNRILDAKGRGVELSPTVLKLDERGMAVFGIGSGEQKRLERREMILQTVRDLGPGMTVTMEVLETLGHPRLIRREVYQLVQNGELLRAGKGTRGDPYRYGLPMSAWNTN